MVQTLWLLVVSVSLDGEQFAERVMEGGTWCWFSHITVLPRVVTVIFVAMIIIAFSLCNSQLFVVVDQRAPRLLSYDWN
jgi:hypothetical protein